MKFKKRFMVRLTRENVALWKSGRMKYAYTNKHFNERTEGLLGVSGRYFYQIDFLEIVPQQVTFSRVPKHYKKCLNKEKMIFRIRAKLMKIEKRKGMY